MVWVLRKQPILSIPWSATSLSLCLQPLTRVPGCGTAKVSAIPLKRDLRPERANNPECGSGLRQQAAARALLTPSPTLTVRGHCCGKNTSHNSRLQGGNFCDGQCLWKVAALLDLRMPSIGTLLTACAPTLHQPRRLDTGPLLRIPGCRSDGCLPNARHLMPPARRPGLEVAGQRAAATSCNRVAVPQDMLQCLHESDWDADGPIPAFVTARLNTWLQDSRFSGCNMEEIDALVGDAVRAVERAALAEAEDTGRNGFRRSHHPLAAIAFRRPVRRPPEILARGLSAATGALRRNRAMCRRSEAVAGGGGQDARDRDPQSHRANLAAEGRQAVVVSGIGRSGHRLARRGNDLVAVAAILHVQEKKGRTIPSAPFNQATRARVS